MNTYVITEYKGHILSGLWEENHAVTLMLSHPEQELLDSIYVGKVLHIAQNIQAAFVEIGTGIPCFLSLDPGSRLFYADGKEHDRLRAGDELIVQVSREAAGVNPPEVTGKITLKGKNLVLSLGKEEIGVSSKIRDKEFRSSVKEILKDFLKPHTGVIVRTQAEGATAEELEKELLLLQNQMETLLNAGMYRSAPSCLYHAGASCFSELLGASSEKLTRIVTDRKDLWKEGRSFLETNRPDLLPVLAYYEGSPSLASVYAVERELKEALSRKVYLKCGGYLVIDRTEALTVIDVNSGRNNINKKDAQETYKLVNVQAVSEACRQIRLRSLSGIILIDFVNLESEEEKKELFELLKAECRKDPIPTQAVDFTRLGLAEITRKKIYRPLDEQAAERKNGGSND